VDTVGSTEVYSWSMKFYLSSFKFGKKKHQLKDLAPGPEILIIPNALDFRPSSDEKTVISLENKKDRLRELGLEPTVVDLKEYFGEPDELKTIIERTGAVFVLGGNVFILRQAMRLSRLDTILSGQIDDPNFLYAGYSAAGCVLAPSLEPYKVVGDATLTPYYEQAGVIWEGLGLVDFAFMPHWHSDHPESAAIDRGIQYCEEHGIKYKAVADGDVLIF
jgi:dipeptidase E